MSGNMSLLGGKSVPAYSSCGYYSDSAVMERAPRRDEYQDGLHIHKTGDFSSDEEVSDDELRDKVAIDLPLETTPFLQTQNRYVNHTSSRRSQSSRAVTKVAQKRNINKLRRDSSNVKKLRVSAYCTCDHISIFKLFKWLEKKEESSAAFTVNENEKLNHYMYTGVVHVAITSATDDASNEAFYREKHAFYFSSGIAVFWGFTRTEEKKHLQALRTFSVGFVKQIEVEDMDFCYGEVRKIVNDAITLSTGDPLEKLAYSFAMAQSAKLDNFEERVEDTIKETRHIPQNLATTGSINYSQNDISKLIGRLFIERNDVNLNSNMLDTPEFFWEFDEWEPLYKKMLRYLDVDNRVQILNSRLDILRELLDVLSQQLAHQHDTKLEWIIIWLIVSEVVVQLVWNMLIKDILGYFPGHPSS